MTRVLIVSLVIALVAGSAYAADKPAAADEAKPSIEVCFVLDTTGSMSGLIEGAKQKIWSIANATTATEPKPTVRIALVGYRDRGDAYVTKRVDLTDDIDAVFANLQQFTAEGGGDTPESVNQALDEAVHQIAWSPGRDVTKIIFLVGDAPPHMDYPDDKKYAAVCAAAVTKDVIINTVQCGSITETTPVWQEIAKKAEGEYVSLGQTGDMVVTATPFDAELASLSAKVNETIVPYGEAQQQQALYSKMEAAATAPAAVAADRASYFAGYAGGGKAVGGRGDLVDDIASGKVKLADVKNDELPEPMRSMTPEQRKAHVEKQLAERKQLQSKVAELNVKRQAHLNEERKRLATSGKKDAFDEKVGAIIATQAARD
jgi:Mg-chelatase subunit ChlD